MKYCPVCKRRFDEPWLSFCSDDGTPLIQELTPPADPNWNPQIREPKVKTPDEEPTQWLPREQPLPGGWIADRWLGLRRTIYYGAVLITVGHFAIALSSIFSKPAVS